MSARPIARMVTGRSDDPLCALLLGDDQRHAAVVDQAVVEEVQRLGDIGRGEVVVDRDWPVVHHRVRVARGPLPLGDGDLAEIGLARPVQLHVAAVHEGIERPLRGQAPGLVVDIGQVVGCAQRAGSRRT